MQEAIKIEHISKEYKLGQISGGTLTGDLQSAWAKLRKKEDPNSKIGSVQVHSGEKFLALDDLSFSVKKGERVGIIGHNGAGKSTLLKLLSRVTAPTSGEISFSGRIASMLEVGTGFHPELTGRENDFMNGAILGIAWGMVLFLAIISIGVAVVPPLGPLAAAAITLALLGLVSMAYQDYQNLPNQESKDCFLSGLNNVLGSLFFIAGSATGIPQFVAGTLWAAGFTGAMVGWYADLPNALKCLGLRAG